MEEQMLRIELRGCRESRDLLDRHGECRDVLSWILMMNRLDQFSGHGAATIAAGAEDASLVVEIPCVCDDAGESTRDRNARNVVADLLGLFDPVDHRVTRTLSSGHGEAGQLAAAWMWPGGPSAHRNAHEVRA